MIIIKTNAGAAMVVAAEIDKLSDELALGCIAGDDTIFIATENEFKGNWIGRKIRFNDKGR